MPCRRLLACLLPLVAVLSIAQAESTSPAVMSAAEDHKRMMQLLQIDALRRGADGDPTSEFGANYDEAQANGNLHSLPDPLRMDDGSAVSTVDDWWNSRRPQIVEHFDREIYGRVPADVPDITWQVRSTAENHVAGVPVITQSIVGVVDKSAYPQLHVEISLSLTTPVSATGPVPVILQFTYGPEFRARLRARFSEEQLAAFNGGGPPWQDQVVERGWAYAELVATSVQADNGEGLMSGIIGLANLGQPRKVDDWGALRAWAWGASRVLDFFATLDTVDESRVGIEGHSRYGKAALVAMAYDSRIAAAFISSSGEGGAKLWRRNFGEQIGNIAGSGEYHWVAGNFLKYAGPLTANDLPVDAHELIALSAPRPVFISSGNDGDQWVDPKGMFLAAAGAGPVYELLGKRGLNTIEYPPIGTALMDGDVSYRQHDLGHTPGPNWPYFLDFAARYFE